MYFIYMRLCFDCSCESMTQKRSVNSYLHMNEWIHMTLHLLYNVHKALFTP